MAGSILGTMATAILFTWVMNGTGGSLLLVLLFHAVHNVTGLFLPTAPPVPALAISWIAALGIIAFAEPKCLARGRRRDTAART